MISAEDEPDVSIPPAVDGLLRVHRRIIGILDVESGHLPQGSCNTVHTRLLVTAIHVSFMRSMF